MHRTSELELGQYQAGVSAASALEPRAEYCSRDAQKLLLLSTAPRGPCCSHPEGCGMQLREGICSVQRALRDGARASLSGDGQLHCGKHLTGGRQGRFEPNLWACTEMLRTFVMRRSLLWELPQGGHRDSQPGGVAAAGAAGHRKNPADNPAAAPRCHHRPWHHPGALVGWHPYKPAHRCATSAAQHLSSLQMPPSSVALPY